jgi:uncharacterized membrane protein YbhN (UPF0104 family)
VEKATALRACGIALATAAFAFTFRNVDLAKAASVVSSVGPYAPLAIVPALVALGLDACAWRTFLGLLGHDVPLWRILRARISVEAVALTVPGGPLAAESLKPELLRDCGVPLKDGIATVGARKVAVLAANALYVVLALVIGFRWLPLPVAIALGVVALVLTALSGGMWFGGTKLRLARFARLQRWLDSPDERVRWLFSAMPARWASLAPPLVMAWLLETVESFIVLRLVGLSPPFGFVLAMEVSVSVLRNVVVAVPAGLGVQDAGYATWLSGFGDPSTAGAFVLVKRMKDVALAAIGYALLALRSATLEPRRA